MGVRSIEENGANLKENTADIAICTLQHVIQDELAGRAQIGRIVASDNEETSKILGLICVFAMSYGMVVEKSVDLPERTC